MRKTWGILPVLMAVGGCSLIPTVQADQDEHGAQAGDEQVVAADGMSIAVPDGWELVDQELPGAVVFGATEVGDESQQLIVSQFDSSDGAEDKALDSAIGIVQQGGACTRLPGDTTFGDPYLVFDCPFTEPKVFRKVLVVLDDGDRSAMVLAQLTVDSLDETTDVITPFLEGIDWE